MRLGVLLTALYVTGVVYAPFHLGAVPTTANEWGDYFAGFLAPVAIAWFIATLSLQRGELILQRDELALQRMEMKLTREVLKDQNKTQLRIAEATLEANEIAASTRFADSVPKHTALLDICIKRMGKELPHTFNKLGGGSTKLSHSGDIDSSLSYFTWLRDNNIGIENSKFTDNQLLAIKYYEHTFDSFRDGAKKTSNLNYILGPYHDLWSMIRAFLNSGAA